MGWNATGWTTTTHTDAEINIEANKYNDTNFASLAIATASLGTALVAEGFKYYGRNNVAANLAAIAGVTIAASTFLSELSNTLNVDGMGEAIDNMNRNGHTRFVIRSTFWEYSSASGNHYTWKTEHTYYSY